MTGLHRIPIFLLLLLGTSLGRTEPESAPVDTNLVIVSFPADADREADRWVTIDDGVFFGASKTRWETPEGEAAVFSGKVSFKRGGGWCSVRRRPDGPQDLSDYAGISIRIRGDGKTYGFNLRNDDKRNGVYYEATFPTIADQWQTIHLGFDDFAPLYLGKAKEGAVPLNLSTIYSYAFVIAKAQAEGQEGEFILEIENIEAFGRTPEEPGARDSE